MGEVPLRAGSIVVVARFVAELDPRLLFLFDLLRNQPLLITFEIKALSLVPKDDLEAVRESIDGILADDRHLLVYFEFLGSLRTTAFIVLNGIAIALDEAERLLLVNHHAFS